MISGKKCFFLLHSEKLIICFAILFLQMPDLLNAQVSHSQELNLTTSSDVELKASFSHEISVPVLNSENVFFTSNEINFEFSAFLSPISIGMGFETVFRPIAFLEFSVGTELGSGWNSRFVRGLALNKPSVSFANDFINKSLKGIVHKEKTGAAFQFDLGAVIPGDWSHIVIRSYHEYYYKAFSTASESESWLWEADEGENRNGTHYYIQNVLGYKMPLMMEFFGLMFEAERSYYDTEMGNVSGENIWNYTASCIMSFRSGESTKFNLISQFRTVRNYTDETEDRDYYRSREIDTDKPRKWEFYRIILSMTHEF